MSESIEWREPLPSITNSEWKITIAPPLGAWLVIHDNFKVACEKLPCRWHRFWYRILLGWRWEVNDG